jgi:hypothetical protein
MAGTVSLACAKERMMGGTSTMRLGDRPTMATAWERTPLRVQTRRETK